MRIYPRERKSSYLFKYVSPKFKYKNQYNKLTGILWYIIVSFLLLTAQILKIKTIFFTQIYIYVIFINNYQKKMTPEAERFNGWAAMLGFVAAVGAYVTTGQIIPGWF